MAHLAPSGHLITPVGFDPSSGLTPLLFDADGNLKIISIANPSGENNIYAWDGATWQKISSDGTGKLNVNISAVTPTVNVAFPATPTIDSDDHVWDGANWQKESGDSSGRARAIPLHYLLWSENGVTQIAKQTTATNNTVTAYTVTNNKTLYVSSSYISLIGTAANTGVGILRFSTSVPAVIHDIEIAVQVNQNEALSLSFNPPLVVTSQGTVKLIVTGTSITGYAGFHGFEI